MLQAIIDFLMDTGFTKIEPGMLVMWLIVAVLFYFAIAKGYEPLLLVPIAFGALIANLPTIGVINDPSIHCVGEAAKCALEHGASACGCYEPGGLYYYLSKGIQWELFPPIIFLGVGALTDFGPLIANPRTLLLGAAAQAGIFLVFILALGLGFTQGEAASIGIIGGADGPTSIFTATKLAPGLIGPIAVAAYTYMSLVPLIQPPIMNLLTTDAEKKIRMKSLRKVGKLERLCFAIVVCILCILLVPPASALIAMLMLGNFLRECGVTERLVKAAQNEIMNTVTIFLGTSVGLTMTAQKFLTIQTGQIILIGVFAFALSTATGVIMAKVMNLFSKNKINPLIGAAGVSAVPMAARVAHNVGAKADPSNYLLMHAMGPNVSGVIGTAVVAGYFISRLGG
ncbi:MAG: sodium ion-translocating decarboxylase subunit beta [Myxococcales bacterium]|jgi:oxaloacetate decarboxylase beta subunit|nr:sodium ion-translocating decarboxylase subunit beta [Myxococcales bacterium]